VACRGLLVLPAGAEARRPTAMRPVAHTAGRSSDAASAGPSGSTFAAASAGNTPTPASNGLVRHGRSADSSRSALAESCDRPKIEPAGPQTSSYIRDSVRQIERSRHRGSRSRNELAAHWQLELRRLLERTRVTGRREGLFASERAGNCALSSTPERTSRARVLVDDVYTSGSMRHAAAGAPTDAPWAVASRSDVRTPTMR